MNRVIADRYELTRSIGAGGMAEVFLATDRRLGRQVAVKILNQGYASQPAFVERFRREAQAAAAIDHPNVVPIYDWGETDDSYFITMGFVAGQTLGEVLALRGPFPEGEGRSLIAIVAGALHHAHQKGIVHRDVKPANILIDESGEPRVTDFGIAQAAGLTSLTETSVVLGSAHYLSPEQASRGTIDARSDIYSLGIVAYEMFTGRPPFLGDSIVEIAMQHVHESPRPPREVRPEISEETERMVLRCLEKDPENRFQSADELRASLEDSDGTPAVGSSTAPTVAIPVSSRQGTAAAAPASIPTRRAPQPGAAGPTPPVSRPQQRTGFWYFGAAIAAIAIVGALALIISQLGGEDSPGPTTPVGTEETEEAEEEITEPETEVEEQPPEQPDTETDTEGEEQPPEEPAGDEPDTSPEEVPDTEEGTDGEEEGETDEQVELQTESEPEAFGNLSCDGSFEGGTADRVIVPGNASCSLAGVIVNDDIRMQQGSTLQATDIEVYGDIQAQGASGLTLGGTSFIDGNIQFERGGSVSVGGARVTGNVQIEDNSGPLTIEGNVIDGNLEAEGNSGGVAIGSNTIDGNLECAGNDPPPSGGGNSVGGNREDQCSEL